MHPLRPRGLRARDSYRAQARLGLAAGIGARRTRRIPTGGKPRLAAEDRSVRSIDAQRVADPERRTTPEGEGELLRRADVRVLRIRTRHCRICDDLRRSKRKWPRTRPRGNETRSISNDNRYRRAARAFSSLQKKLTGDRRQCRRSPRRDDGLFQAATALPTISAPWRGQTAAAAPCGCSLRAAPETSS